MTFIFNYIIVTLFTYSFFFFCPFRLPNQDLYCRNSPFYDCADASPQNWIGDSRNSNSCLQAHCIKIQYSHLLISSTRSKCIACVHFILYFCFWSYNNNKNNESFDILQFIKQYFNLFYHISEIFHIEIIFLRYQ